MQEDDNFLTGKPGGHRDLTSAFRPAAVCMRDMGLPAEGKVSEFSQLLDAFELTNEATAVRRGLVARLACLMQCGGTCEISPIDSEITAQRNYINAPDDCA